MCVLLGKFKTKIINCKIVNFIITMSTTICYLRLLNVIYCVCFDAFNQNAFKSQSFPCESLCRRTAVSYVGFSNLPITREQYVQTWCMYDFGEKEINKRLVLSKQLSKCAPAERLKCASNGGTERTLPQHPSLRAPCCKSQSLRMQIRTVICLYLLQF